MSPINRQPKGTQEGGQFASGVNPESAVIIANARTYEPLAAVGEIFVISGVEVVEWRYGGYEDDIVMQVWKESECVDPVYDWEGYEPRALAQILTERSPGKTEFDVNDVYELFMEPDSDVSWIAFRPGMDSSDLLHAIEKEIAQ